MPKDFIKRYMPDHRRVREHRHLQIFGKALHDPNLWHLNRRSASGAFAVGLFVAFMPIPFQMVLAAALAIAARVNLVISVALVWVTNPVTIPPMFYSAYRLGAYLLDEPVHAIRFELSLEWFMGELALIWQPLLLGSFILGTISGATGYLLIRGLWRLRLTRQMVRRKQERNARGR